MPTTSFVESNLINPQSTINTIFTDKSKILSSSIFIDNSESKKMEPTTIEPESTTSKSEKLEPTTSKPEKLEPTTTKPKELEITTSEPEKLEPTTSSPEKLKPTIPEVKTTDYSIATTSINNPETISNHINLTSIASEEIKTSTTIIKN